MNKYVYLVIVSTLVITSNLLSEEPKFNKEGGSNIIEPKVVIIDGKISNLSELPFDFMMKLCSAKSPVSVNGQLLRVSPSKEKTDPMSILGYNAAEFALYQRIRNYSGLLHRRQSEIESGADDKHFARLAKIERDKLLTEIASLPAASEKSGAIDKLKKEMQEAEAEFSQTPKE